VKEKTLTKNSEFQCSGSNVWWDGFSKRTNL